jgi:hypothetical protein
MKSSRRSAKRRKIRRVSAHQGDARDSTPRSIPLLPARRVFGIEVYFKQIEIMFWIVYASLPFLTGWMDYRPLMNEHYDPSRHELLEFHMREGWPNGLGTYKVPDSWRDAATGQAYSVQAFSQHHQDEARRLGLTCLAYGLVGCVFFAYGRVIRKKSTFMHAFRNALYLTAAISILAFWIA